MKTLYRLESEWKHFLDYASDNGGELPPEAEAWMEGFVEDQEMRLGACVNALRHLRMEEAAAKAEAEQWQAKTNARGRAAERLQLRMLAFLRNTQQSKVVTVDGVPVSVVRNGGKLPVVLADPFDPNTLPEKYQRVRIMPDLTAISEDLEAGVVLPFAKFGERGVRLKIG